MLATLDRLDVVIGPAQLLLDASGEPCAPIAVRAAIERKLVGRGPEIGGGELVERLRVPDLVLRDRREGDVLLEERRYARPLRVAPAEDQFIAGELEKEISSRAF